MGWETFKPFRSLQLQSVDAGILTQGSKDKFPSAQGVPVSVPMCWSTLTGWPSPRMRSSGRSHGRGCSWSSSLMGWSSPKDGQRWSWVVVRKPPPSLSLPPWIKSPEGRERAEQQHYKGDLTSVLYFSDKGSGKLHRSLKPATRALLGWARETALTLRQGAALHIERQKNTPVIRARR